MSSTDDGAAYRMAPGVSYQVLGRDHVEVFARGRTMRLSLHLFRLLLELAEPRALRELHSSLKGRVPLEDLVTFCARLEASGVLVRTDRPEPAPPSTAPASFRELFRPDVFGDEGVVAAISAQLDAGRAVVIQDAVRPDFAERVWQDLDRCTAFRPYEVQEPLFHHHHHNLYVEAEFPPSLRECRDRFASVETRELVGRLSGRDCAGRLMFGASLYLPGDHSLPHRDHGYNRTVAFVWHLTKDWDRRWGGSLYWLPSGTIIAPQFNCFTIFNVGEHSLHFVGMVSPYARGRRLAVNGWWTGLAEPGAVDAPAAPPPDIGAPLYGAAHALLTPDGRVRAV